MSDRRTVLHLAGSASSPFYSDLSLVYATAGLRPDAFDHKVAVVEPGGRWRLGTTLEDLAAAVGAPTALAELEGGVDLVVPYMFDLSGMTSFRSLFEDVLGVPVVGSVAAVTSVAANKALTKSILGEAGVPVPASYTADSVDEFPVIVKPATEDNSRGLSLVRTVDQLEPAVAEAESFDDTVMIEQYIEGREIRVAVIETDDGLVSPAMLEYAVSDENPVRSVDAKLALDDGGNPTGLSAGPIPAICPAPIEPELRDRLSDLAAAAHVALGCRDYSLFDVRVDRSGEPYFLEAGLFWTFGEPSIITRMIRGGGREPQPIIEALWRRAAARRSLLSPTSS